MEEWGGGGSEVEFKVMYGVNLDVATRKVGEVGIVVLERRPRREEMPANSDW
jgi:hypothetical protein